MLEFATVDDSLGEHALLGLAVCDSRKVMVPSVGGGQRAEFIPLPREQWTWRWHCLCGATSRPHLSPDSAYAGHARHYEEGLNQ